MNGRDRTVGGVRPLRLAAMPGDPPTPHDDQPTVREYLDDWLWGKQSLSPSTHAGYEIHIRRYLSPHLGHLDLEALRPTHIERMFRALRLDNTGGRQITVATQRRIHATLMSALSTAVRRGLIERNPAATVELPRPARTLMRSWTSDELNLFLNRTEDHPLHVFFLLLAITGLRRGEAIALRWADVDLNAGHLRVEHSTVRVGGSIVTGPPKSTAGRRVVALAEETTRRLTWHQCRQRLATLNTGNTDETPGLVFTDAAGDGLDPAYVSRVFARLVEDHGPSVIRLHDLRHTSASIGLAAGESLVEVSRRLGHSSISITADIYSHISPEVARSSAERLAQTVYKSAVEPIYPEAP